MSSPKTIGVLTSGGDCAGLNAVIRAVVARAVRGYGWRVLGIRQGTHGLLRRPVDVAELDLQSATSAMARMAGTILGTTNRGDPVRLSDAGRQPARPLGGGHRGRPPARPRRADRHRRRRQLRHPAPPGPAGRLPPGRHPQDDRQRCGRHRELGRLPHRGDGGDRGDRPAAAHGGQPRPGHDPRGDGARQRPHRAGGRHRRRRRRDPGAGDPLRHRRRCRAYQQAARRPGATSPSSWSPRRCATTPARVVQRQHAPGTPPMAASATCSARRWRG